MTTIWLVDDDDVVVQTIACILEAYHYKVERFHSGQLFIDAFNNQTRPDLIIMDIMMHPPPDGNEVIRYLSHFEHPPVLAITGNIEMIAGDVLTLLAGIIPKPCTMHDLKTIIEIALHGMRSPLHAN